MTMSLATASLLTSVFRPQRLKSEDGLTSQVPKHPYDDGKPRSDLHCIP